MRHAPRPADPSAGRSTPWPVPRSVWGLLPAQWIRTHRAFPVAVERGERRPTLVVAMVRPDDLIAIDDIAFATGMRVKPIPAAPEDLDRAIAVHLGPSPGPEPAPGGRVAVEQAD